MEDPQVGSPVRLPDLSSPEQCCTMSKPRDYSSQSYSPSSTGPSKSYPTANKIDPSGKSREKDDLVGLNDKFVRLIDKVCRSNRPNFIIIVKINGENGPKKITIHKVIEINSEFNSEDHCFTVSKFILLVVFVDTYATFSNLFLFIIIYSIFFKDYSVQINFESGDHEKH